MTPWMPSARAIYLLGLVVAALIVAGLTVAWWGPA